MTFDDISQSIADCEKKDVKNSVFTPKKAKKEVIVAEIVSTTITDLWCVAGKDNSLSPCFLWKKRFRKYANNLANTKLFVDKKDVIWYYIITKNKRCTMAVCYKKLWKMLIDKDMKKKDLASLAGVSSFTISKMSAGKSVTVDILGKICKALNCTIEEIMEFIPDDEGKE